MSTINIVSTSCVEMKAGKGKLQNTMSTDERYEQLRIPDT